MLLQVVAASAALLVLLAVYFTLMRLSIDVSRVDETHSAEDRDTVYLWIHLGVLVMGGVAGFGLGKWLNGLGVAYGTLFVAVLVVGMTFGQLGSRSLACDGGRNDVLRHWDC